jgi:hypothetical protein
MPTRRMAGEALPAADPTMRHNPAIGIMRQVGRVRHVSLAMISQGNQRQDGAGPVTVSTQHRMECGHASA